MSNKNPNEISKLWKTAVDWPCHDGPHTYNGIYADTYINMYYGETSCYSEADAFASDIATSVPFVDPEDENRSVDMDVFDQMHTLWEVARLPFAEFLSLLKLTPSLCATRFCSQFSGGAGRECEEGAGTSTESGCSAEAG